MGILYYFATFGAWKQNLFSYTMAINKSVKQIIFGETVTFNYSDFENLGIALALKFSYGLIFFAALATVWPCYAQSSCDNLFPLDHKESQAWITDSLGQNKARAAIYLRHFCKRAGVVRSSYTGIDKACVMDVFGPPNFVRQRGQEEGFVYYIEVIFDNEDIPRRGYEGMTLEITFKENKIVNLSVFIT